MRVHVKSVGGGYVNTLKKILKLHTRWKRVFVPWGYKLWGIPHLPDSRKRQPNSNVSFYTDCN